MTDIKTPTDQDIIDINNNISDINTNMTNINLQVSQVVNKVDNKIDKDGNKVLSDNNYTNEDKSKVDKITTIENDINTRALKSELDKTNTQLEDIVQDTNNQLKNIQRSYNSINPLVSFIDDDGYYSAFLKLKTISIEKNVPFTMACFTKTSEMLNSQVNIDLLLDMQNSYNWEIASHTRFHVDLTQVDEILAEKEIKLSKIELEKLGFNINTIVYPLGHANQFVYETASKYYRAGVNVGVGKLNDNPINTFNLERVMFAPDDILRPNTLEFYKSQVDLAISENKWLIFICHAYQSNFDAIQEQYMRDLIDYIASKGIEITTVNEGINKRGNVIEVRQGEGFVLQKNGKITNKTIDNIGVTRILPTGINNTTPRDNFPNLKISVTSFLSKDGETGFPKNNLGTLITNRNVGEKTLDNQLWFPRGATTFNMRNWNGTTEKWDNWVEFSASQYAVTIFNSYNATNTINDFNKGVTVTDIQTGHTDGLPPLAVAGTLTTYKGNYREWHRQKFEKIQAKDTWIRYVTTGDVWTNWEKIM